MALHHHEAGRLADAEALYRQILAVQPNHGDALHLLGVIAYQVYRNDMAADLIRQAIAARPTEPHYYVNLGNALVAQGCLSEAITAFRHALQLNPDYPDAHNNLGNALVVQGHLEEAIAAFRHALKVKPDFPDAHNNLGVALKNQGDLNEAIAAFRRALEIKPDYAEAHSNLGDALRERGQLDEAVAACRQAIQIKSDLPGAYNNLGNALREGGHLDEAIAACRRAIQLKPESPESHANLGNALKDLCRLDEAIAVFRRALELKPDFPQACNNLGNVLRERGQLDEAVALFRRALQIKPDFPDAHNNLGGALMDQGKVGEAIASYRHALQLRTEDAKFHSSLLYTLHFYPSRDDRMIVEERRRWNLKFNDPLKRLVLPYANDRSSERKLRIGYVSPDFRDHVIGRYLVPLFKSHDHENFEIFCYADVMRPDNVTEEFRQYSHQWRSTIGVGDEALVEMIRRDGVDILVDLTQHMAGNRLPMFVRKPAPVQVSFAGYPESTGLEAIENRISDKYLEGDSADAKAEGKERVCLIDSFWCYDPCGVQVDVTPLPALKRGAVTFGCLNNFCKVNELVLRLWAQVLGKMKDSSLIISSHAGVHRQRTLEALGSEGVKTHRVEFVDVRPRRKYLELYHRLDIALDTFPYNGGVTTCDALWMGVPVVSLAGETSVARAGLSVLTNLGFPELAAHSESEYVNIAESLARDLPRLAQLRSTLRNRMENSVLMDAPRFARNVEAAYRSMWKRWCSSGN